MGAHTFRGESPTIRALTESSPGGSGFDFEVHGSPEGVQIANVGKTAIDLDSGAVYVKTGTDGTNTGWVTSAVRLAEDADFVSGAVVSVPLDGGSHAVPCIVGSPPSWMDDAGNIIKPGVYTLLAVSALDVDPTTAGLYIGVGSSFNANWNQAVDAIRFMGAVTFTDVMPLGVDDGLPWDVTCQWVTQADDTGIIHARVKVGRIAYNLADV